MRRVRYHGALRGPDLAAGTAASTPAGPRRDIGGVLAGPAAA
jgi:hypothetical protein